MARMPSVAVGLLVALLGTNAAKAAARPRPAKAPVANPIQTENARPGDSGWKSARPSTAAIQGYASQVSVQPGDTLELHVSTSYRYRIDIDRLGWYGGAGGRRVTCIPDCGASERGSVQTTPQPDSATGEVDAGWPITDRVPVPVGWTSGYYLARFMLVDGPDAGASSSYPFVVRAPGSRRSQILVQVPVNTWQAYNPWGGKSLYGYNSTGGIAATQVSFNRPYAPGAQTPFMWEYQLVRFLERAGYDLSYTTDVDTDRNPAQLLQHQLVIVAGHDEYWSRTMRDAFEAARDAGVNLIFAGSNVAYWQIRYQQNGRTMVAYKSSADPFPDPLGRTIKFRDLAAPRPECMLLGVQYRGGVQESSEQAHDYVVSTTSDPWFAGTAFRAGDVLPALVGYEWDSVQPGCRPPGLKVLFHYAGPSPADAVRYSAPSGAQVFSSGSLQFVWGLENLPERDRWDHEAPLVNYPPADPRLQRFVRNAVDDLSSVNVVVPSNPRLGDLLAGRVRVAVRCARACAASLQLTLAASAARSLRINPTLAQGAATLDRAGTEAMSLRVSSRAADLRRLVRSNLPAVLRVNVTDGTPLGHVRQVGLTIRR